MYLQDVSAKNDKVSLIEYQTQENVIVGEKT
jgi:hypothetical protein